MLADRLAPFAYIFLAVLALAHPANAASPSDPLSKDQPSASDSALTGRYKDAVLLLQTHKAFDELTLPSGPEVGEDFDPTKRFASSVTAKGEVTRAIYVSPPGRSTLEVVTNYSDALIAKGFAPMFECAAGACGPAFRKLKYSWDNPATHVVGLDIDVPRQAFVKAIFDAASDLRYGLYRRDQTYVALFGALNGGGGFGETSKALNDRVSVLVEIVEPKAMEQNIVVLDATSIAQALSADGAVSLYGLYFDTDKATLQPKSKPQLDQMGRFLTDNPAIQVYVAGHTDNQGPLDHNMTLSDARAKAVAAALTKAYGIAAGRLIARGIGPLAPAATNATEPGRAKNRRVQLVLATASTRAATEAARAGAGSKLGGPWTISRTSEWPDVCALTLLDSATIGGFDVKLDRGCQRSFAWAGAITAWHMAPDGDLVLADAVRHGVIHFKRETDGDLIGPGPDGQDYIITPDRAKPLPKSAKPR